MHMSGLDNAAIFIRQQCLSDSILGYKIDKSHLSMKNRAGGLTYRDVQCCNQNSGLIRLDVRLIGVA